MDNNYLVYLNDVYDTLTEYYHHTTYIQHKALAEALDEVPIGVDPDEDFSNLIHAIYGSIWDCKVNEPEGLTVGEILEDVIEIHSAQKQGWVDAERDQVARDIATIIENENDMRVILKNSRCTDDRLISEKDVVKAVDKHTFDTDKGLCLDDDITCILENVPTTEPQRIKGKWIRKKYNRGGNSEWNCSICGFQIYAEYVNLDYCPSCGNKMGD